MLGLPPDVSPTPARIAGEEDGEAVESSEDPDAAGQSSDFSGGEESEEEDKMSDEEEEEAKTDGDDPLGTLFGKPSNQA